MLKPGARLHCLVCLLTNQTFDEENDSFMETIAEKVVCVACLEKICCVLVMHPEGDGD